MVESLRNNIQKMIHFIQITTDEFKLKYKETLNSSSQIIWSNKEFEKQIIVMNEIDQI